MLLRLASSQSEGICGGSENSLAMTLLWFFVWLIANLIGDEEGLTFDPVNFWAGWLLLGPRVGPRRRARQAGLQGRTLDRIRDACPGAFLGPSCNPST